MFKWLIGGRAQNKTEELNDSFDRTVEEGARLLLSGDLLWMNKTFGKWPFDKATDGMEAILAKVVQHLQKGQ